MPLNSDTVRPHPDLSPITNVDHPTTAMNDHVELRPVRETDLHTLYLHQLDPEATEMAAFPSRDRKSFDAHWARILANDSLTKKTILFNSAVAGHIGAFDADGDRLVGYWIGREFWGKGIATRALKLFLDHETHRPLLAHVAQGNIGSIRVLEKCGFSRIRAELGLANGQMDEEVVFQIR